MTPLLLTYLCDPITKKDLRLTEAIWKDGRIEAGYLESPDGVKYPISRGIPRFANRSRQESVESFGDEWNHFNFTDFQLNWLTHTVANTFGSKDVFRDKIVVDAGGGSGAQSLWILESGAKHVVMLELSHSVDDVVVRNIDSKRFPNFDVIQCSIDAPPIKDNSIAGMVYCHNVIQHTPSVENTARALFRIVAPGGEFVFNCYGRNDQGFFRWVRFHCIYTPLRYLLSKLSFGSLLNYARIAAVLRLVPIVGYVMEKTHLCVQGDVPILPAETLSQRLKRRYKTTMLNTFDSYGSHSYQHHKSDDEIRNLIASLQSDPQKILNTEKYFSRPAPIGCALRIQK